MAKQKTYVMIKPGFTEHEEQIVKRLEGIGAKVVARKTMLLNDDILNNHYAEHIGKEFFAGLVEYMKSGEVVGFYIERESESDLISDVRRIVGATKNPEPGTIRYDFGIGEITRNVIHASDSDASAERELKIFFPELV